MRNRPQGVVSKASTLLLHQDLERQADGVKFGLDVDVDVPGMGPVTIPILATLSDGQRFAIALAGGLTGDHPADPRIAEMRETWPDLLVIPVNELLVRGNLPAASLSVLSAIA